MKRKAGWWNKPIDAKSTIIILMVFAILCAFFYLYPTDKAVMLPGKPFPASKLINTQAHDANSGQIYLLPVRVTERAWTIESIPAINANPLMIILGWMVPGAQTYQIEEFVRNGTNQTQYVAQNQVVNRLAQSVPLVVAYREAKVEFKTAGSGLRIIGFNEDGNAVNHLKLNDVIYSVDKKDALTIAELLASLANKTNETVLVQIVRNEEKQEIKIQLVKGKLGIVVQEEPPIALYKEHNISIRDIRGNSGDLGVALHVYSILTQNDLTKGRKIAASGTLLPNGTVLPVGAAKLKAWEANKAETQILLMHPADVAIAEQSETMKIVPVNTLREAIDYLEGS